MRDGYRGWLRWVAWAGCLALMFCVLGNSGCGSSSSSSPPVARTRSGMVRGTASSGVYAFLGIPFAASTAGDNRWKAPERESAWDGLRDATRYGAICPQPIEMEMGTDAVSEDCLFLNVWTPDLSESAELPVIFWVPGGGYVFGAGSQPVYEGADLALNGVVVVTINYRVNAFGFLAHDWLAQGSGPASNFGLLDQIAALEWVRDSIRAFGGNPDNVAIAGVSAGSSSTTHLASMSLASGLYHKVIAMSGTSPADYYVSEGLTSSWTQAAANGAALAAAVNATSLEELRAVGHETLLAAYLAQDKASIPVMDGYSITTPPRTALAGMASVPVMLGSLPRDSVGVMDVASTVPEYVALLQKHFAGQWQTVFAAYPAVDEDSAQAMSLFTMTTAGFTEPARFAARQAASKQTAVYRYFITAVPDGEEGKYGAAHGTEIAYLFGSATPGNGYSEQDAEFSALIQTYWANFARTGDPNGSGLAAWPAFTSGNKYTMQLDKTGNTVLDDLYESDCDFFESIYPTVPVDNP